MSTNPKRLRPFFFPGVYDSTEVIREGVRAASGTVRLCVRVCVCVCVTTPMPKTLVEIITWNLRTTAGLGTAMPDRGAMSWWG